jgi:DNA-binding XRE family transcriptional regulator
MKPITSIRGERSPVEQRRDMWGRNLSEAMDLHGYTVKSFHRALLDDGLDVSPQAIYAWRNGTSAPTVEKQVVLARVLRSPVAALFPPVAA